MSLEKLFNNTLLISDIDLDGAGAIAISKDLIPNIEYKTPNRQEVDKTVQEAIKSNVFKHIILTDCSIKEEETAKLVDEFVSNGNHFIVLDHHATALWLNKYSWGAVKVETNGFKHSGTELAYQYYKNLGFDVSKYEILVELIRSYDTWVWTITSNQNANQLNTLFWFWGLNTFLNKMDKVFKSDTTNIIREEDLIILQTLEEVLRQYIDEKKKLFKVISFENYKVAIIFADKHSSILGNVICDENEDIDICAIINLDRESVSLRCKKGKADCSEIAKRYNGGGHKEASGFTLNKEIKETILKLIF